MIPSSNYICYGNFISYSFEKEKKNAMLGYLKIDYKNNCNNT